MTLEELFETLFQYCPETTNLKQQVVLAYQELTELRAENHYLKEKVAFYENFLKEKK